MNGIPEGEPDGGYAAPVRQLLNIGEARSYRPSDWPDYRGRLGLQREHIADLIRMASDAGLNQADAASSEIWAPLHAWRALGQMRAEEAVLPLLALLRANEDDEAAAEDAGTASRPASAASPASTTGSSPASDFWIATV